MKPIVSVIMCVYNDEQYLSKAIESILEQSFENFEFIICDDCSTDKSLEIIESYAEKNERIIVLKNKKNLGLAATLNKCIGVARGKYIARMDSDDISLNHRLERELIFLNQNPNVSVVGTQVEYIDKNGIPYKKSNLKILKPKFEDVLKKCCVIHPTVMMRKKDLEEVGGYTSNTLTRRAEDYDLWCKLGEKKFKIEIIDEYLFYYREDKNGLKKRKYKHRVEEFRLKKYWIKKCSNNKRLLLFAYKPLLVGLIPDFIMTRRKIK